MLKIDQLLTEIEDRIWKGNGDIYPHDSCIIVGNNMTGKSDLIKDVLSRNRNKNIYFIDSLNRTIAKDNPSGLFNQISNISDILNYRIAKDIFNNKDSITYKFGSSLILNELLDNFEQYEKYIDEYLGYEFKIIIGEDEGDVLLTKNEDVYKYKVEGKNVSELSNGLQAIIRILVEVIFAVSRGVNIIVIEEIDSYLDSENSKNLVKFLKTEFENIKWIFTTHSPQVILGSEGFNIFKIEDGECSYFDGDDMINISYINRTLFKHSKINEDKINNELSNLLRLLSIGKSIEPNIIKKINSYKTLTVKQNILRKYINEWNNEN